MPEINGNLQLVHNPWADTAHCFVWHKSGAPFFSVSQVIEQGKFIQDGDYISIPLDYDTAINYNYLIGTIQTYGVEGAYFPAYFFITEYNYKNADTTEIRIVLDTMQTFYSSIARINGHLSRAHAPRYITIEETGGGTHKMINPDLFFIEDDIAEKYLCTGYKADASGDTDNYICIVFTMSASDFNSLELPHKMDFAPIVDIDTIFKDYAPAPEGAGANYYGYPDYNSATWHLAELKNYNIPGLEGKKGTLAVSAELMFGALTKTPNFRGANRTQTFCLLIEPKAGEIPGTRSQYGENPQVNIGNLWACDIPTILQFCPLLQERIVNIFNIPRPSGTAFSSAKQYLINSGAAVEGLTARFGAWFTSTTGNQLFLDNIQYEPFADFLLITDISALSFVFGNGYGFVHGKDPSIKTFATESTEGGSREVEKEAKLKIYPYNFENITFLGVDIPLIYQNYFWILGSTDAAQYALDWEKIVVDIDPLATTPTFFARTLADPYAPMGLTGSDYLIGADLTLLPRNSMPDNGGSFPTCAIYQDNYTNYAMYSKALDISTKEYNTTMTKWQGASQIIGGAGDIIGGVLGGIGKGGLAGWGKAIGGVSSGTTSILGGIATLTNTPAYLNEQQNLKESVAQIKPPAQSGGAYAGNLTYLAEGGKNTIVARRMEYPTTRKNIIENKFYYTGYSIPIDIELATQELENAEPDTPDLATVINDRRYFCYLQFDSISVLSFLSADGNENTPALIPTIYRDDIAARLINGITFVHVGRGAPGDGDISRYNIPVNMDNESGLSLFNKPFFNRNWRGE